jgi:hypothetical protein
VARRRTFWLLAQTFSAKVFLSLINLLISGVLFSYYSRLYRCS